MWSVSRVARPVFCLCVLVLSSTVAISAQNIHLGALKNDLVQIEAAIIAGASPNDYNLVGFAPLHVAARAGSVAMARLLLQYGADVNIQSQDGNADTPLQLSILNGHLPMTDFFLDNGADPNIANNFGNTPLHDSLVTNDGLGARQLMESGADPDILEGEDSSVLLDLLRSLLFQNSFSFSAFIQVPFTDSAAMAFYPAFSEYILRDIFLAVYFQSLISINSTVAIGIELGTHLSVAAITEHVHLEIPAHIVVDIKPIAGLSTQIYTGTHLLFPNLNIDPSIAFRFELGARVGLEVGRNGEVIIDATYLLPIVLSVGDAKGSQFNSASQSANNLRLGAGYRIKL